MALRALSLKTAPLVFTSVSFIKSCVILYGPACGWQTAKNGWTKKVPILIKRKNKYRLIMKSTTHRVPRSQLTTRFTKSDTTTKGAHVRRSSFFRRAQILRCSSRNCRFQQMSAQHHYVMQHPALCCRVIDNCRCLPWIVPFRGKKSSWHCLWQWLAGTS